MYVLKEKGIVCKDELNHSTFTTLNSLNIKLEHKWFLSTEPKFEFQSGI